jgi:alpha/beta hydrolase fold
MDMPYTDNHGVRIHYQVEGSGPPLILQHGFTDSLETWYELGYVGALSRERQLILVDARGHGASDKPHHTAAYTNEARARRSSENWEIFIRRFWGVYTRHSHSRSRAPTTWAILWAAGSVTLSRSTLGNGFIAWSSEAAGPKGTRASAIRSCRRCGRVGRSPSRRTALSRSPRIGDSKGDRRWRRTPKSLISFQAIFDTIRD